MAKDGRYQQAVKLLRDALRYDPANDGLFRMLYRLCLAQDSPGQASKVLKQYHQALSRENFPEQEIEEALQTFVEDKSVQNWLVDD
jgi:tetratricopeptide (TPR) repeat protein